MLHYQLLNFNFIINIWMLKQIIVFIIETNIFFKIIFLQVFNEFLIKGFTCIWDWIWKDICVLTLFYKFYLIFSFFYHKILNRFKNLTIGHLKKKPAQILNARRWLLVSKNNFYCLFIAIKYIKWVKKGSLIF